MDRLAAACPGCGRRLDEGQVVCISCGYDLRRDRKIDTKVRHVRDRALARRAKRRAANLGVRLMPWAVGVAQTAALARVCVMGTSGPEAHATAELVLRSYLALGGVIILTYAVREVGAWALLFRAAVWWVLLADDANPYMVGLFGNLLLTPILAITILQHGG